MKKLLSVALAALLVLFSAFAAPVGFAEPLPEQAEETQDEDVTPLFETKDEALRFIREKLTERTSEISFRYTDETFGIDDILAYEGSAPDEGDYLRFHLACFPRPEKDEDGVYHIDVTYHSTAQQEQAVSEAVDALLAAVDPAALTDYQKAILVYDLLCDEVVYNENASANIDHTAYAALIEGSSACQGFALAYYRLARELGLDCRIVVGDLLEEGNNKRHAWNAVRIGESWYYADATNGSTAPDRYLTFMTPLDNETYSLCPKYQSENDSVFMTANEVRDLPFNKRLTGVCGDGVEWRLDPLTGILRIVGEGAMDAFPADDARWLEYREILSVACIDATVTSVCDGCFDGCDLTLHCVEGSAAHLWAQENMPGRFHLASEAEPYTPPTCTTEGQTALLRCGECGGLTFGSEPLRPAGHRDGDGDGACDACGLDVNYSDHGFCGEAVNWYYYDDGRLILTGAGAMDDYTDKTSAPWDAHAQTIKQLAVADGIENIGDYAFYGCRAMETASLPDGLKSIGAYAFAAKSSRESSALSDINIPASVTSIGKYAFRYCTALTSVDLPTGLQTLSYGAFYYTGLTSVTLPNASMTMGKSIFAYSALREISFAPGTELIPEAICKTATKLTRINFSGSELTIGPEAFYQCSQLSEVTLPEHLVNLNSDAFGYTAITEITIPKTIKTAVSFSLADLNGASLIGLTPFRDSELRTVIFEDGLETIPAKICEGANKLTDVHIPASVKTIRSRAFAQCYKLPGIELPEGLTSIGDEVFQDCWALSGIVLPESVTSIGDKAFSVCSKLTNIILPGSVTSIGSYAFSGCRTLTQIDLPESLTSIGGHAFYNCKALTQIDIPESVTSIGNSAFSYCISLTEIAWPESVTGIGNYTFSGCSSLTDVVLPESLTSIGEYAFKNCTAMTNLILPGSVANIGRYAFQGCAKLASVFLPSADAAIGASAFKGCSANLALHCPAGSTAAEWATQNSVVCHTNYLIDKVEQKYCSGEEHLLCVAYCNECERAITLHGLIDAQGHSIAEDREVPATCTKSGLTAGEHCSVCGLVLEEQQVVPAKGHTETEIPAKEPTCTVSGHTAGVKCADCGKPLVRTETIPATGHTVEIVPGKAETCTEDGLTEGSRCSVCDKILEKQTVIPAKGHHDADKDEVCDDCGAQLHKENVFLQFIQRIGELWGGILRWFKNVFKRSGR